MASSLYVHNYASASGEAAEEGDQDAFCVLELCDPRSHPEADPSSITFFGALSEAEEGGGIVGAPPHRCDSAAAVATRPPGFLSRVLAAFLRWIRNRNAAGDARRDSRGREGEGPEEFPLVQL
ncbi:unnamed protein product [Lampetra planeri]